MEASISYGSVWGFSESPCRITVTILTVSGSKEAFVKTRRIRQMELVPESFKVEQECTKDIEEKDPGDCENLTV